MKIKKSRSLTPTEEEFSALCKEKGLVQKIVIKNLMQNFIDREKQLSLFPEKDLK
jgi:hypothetical protein